MKCTDEECYICEQQISSPDSKNLFNNIYNQFLGFEKKLKEENEELCLIIKVLLLKIIDEDKIHRISYMILKNTKVGLSTYLKINYIYEKLLEEMNHDLKNLLTIKYGEVYDDLLFIINYFEEIFGFVKSRTEKVELVINKTNDVGQTYQKIISNLFFLKRNKRIYFDTYNMLQIICLIRLIFQRNVDNELIENLEYNFQDFLENVDRIFEDNLSFIVRYDFYDFNWRIKKVPKTFIDLTRSKVDDLIDQSLEKIFPTFMAKSIIKQMEELITGNKDNRKLNLKTFVLDSESNVRYVKFEIVIIPNLHSNYLLYLHCHFQQKHIMIIDEAGNFVNGCHEFYKKIGIKSEVVSMSRGKINMYNVFNIDKNCRLEDVKIVSINIDNLLDIIKKVYLIDNENINFDTIPPFLYDLFNLNGNTNLIRHGTINVNQQTQIQNIMGSNINPNQNITNSIIQANNQLNPTAENYNTTNISRGSGGNNNGSQITVSGNAYLDFMRNNPNSLNMFMNHTMKKFRDNNIIYLSLFETINIHNKKYIVYSIKIKTGEHTRKENKFDDEENNLNKLLKPHSKDSIISAVNEKSGLKSNNLTESDLKPLEKNNNSPQNLNNDLKNNFGEHYNYFNETNRSASLEMDYNKNNTVSVLSLGNSSTSDVFTFLLLKNAPKNTNRADYFKNFLSFIYIFNLFLVVLGLFSIIYLNTYTKNTISFIETFQIFSTLRTNIISSTFNMLAMCKFTNDDILNTENSNYFNNTNNNLTISAKSQFTETFDDFFKENLKANDLYSPQNKFSYDSLIKDYNSFYAEIILDSYKKFEKSSYNLYGPIDFDKFIDYYTNIIIFNSIGNPVITRNKISDTLDYIPITINTINKRSEEKIYININYLTFKNDFLSSSVKLEDTSILDNISLYERNIFNQNNNLYKFFINYFSLYEKNFETINNSFFNFGSNYTNRLQLIANILLILIVIMHVLFVLVSLSSIFIYKKILLKEFNSLYSISEENLTKLKDKFKCVEEIIKCEKYPSKVYMDLRRMRELENYDKIIKNKKHNQTDNGFRSNNTVGNSSVKKFNIEGSNINNSLNKAFQKGKMTSVDPKLTKFSQVLNNDQQGNSLDEGFPLNETKFKFFSPNAISKKGETKNNVSKFERKPTSLSKSINETKDKALENYYSYNYSGATKGLQKSMSIKNKEKMEEIKKQHSKAQASMMLLSRLNFEFEFINNYVKFIVFMSIFYITLGILVLLILEQKYNSFNESIVFMDTFIDKNVNIFNYLIGVKLAIILNRKWPNTIKPENFDRYTKYKFEDIFDLNDPIDISKLNEYGFYTDQGIINNFYNASNMIFEMENKHPFFEEIFLYENQFNGPNTCSYIYTNKNEILNKLSEENPGILNNLINLCKKIPIMYSNLPSIFSNVIRELREILNDFINQGEVDVAYRVQLLQNKFRIIDTIFFIFIEPHFKYIRDYLLKTELNYVVFDYFNFLIIIFTLNIFIDFLMLIFIWFKNYKQVIKYVNNIQLVADSITN